MYGLEIYHRVRRAVLRDGMSERAAALAFGIDRATVSKMLRFSEPPGYRLKSQRPRSRMDAHADFVDQILISDREVPKKQRHTVRRIFERLRDERGFEGGYTTVRDYVRPRRQHLKEAFVRSCQTNANQSQYPRNRRNLGRTEQPPLFESGGSVELEITT